MPYYGGRFPVIIRSEKTFVVDVREKIVTVTIDRLKPAYVISDDVLEEDFFLIMAIPTPATTCAIPKEDQRTRSGWKVLFLDRLQMS